MVKIFKIQQNSTSSRKLRNLQKPKNLRNSSKSQKINQNIQKMDGFRFEVCCMILFG